MQMMTRPAILALGNFLKDRRKTPSSTLVDIPILRKVLEGVTEAQQYPKNLLGLCQWMYERGQTVLGKLLVHTRPPDSEKLNLMEEEGAWRRVS